jgi:hypothetical protein
MRKGKIGIAVRGTSLHVCTNADLSSCLSDDFIDDQDISAGQNSRRDYISWRTLPEQDQGPDEMLAGILQRARDSSTHIGGSVAIIPIREAPVMDDFPLWRVRCRVSP